MTTPVYPHDIPSECAVLGGMFKNVDTLSGALAELSADDFHRPEHAALFDLMRSMVRTGAPVDLITVPEAVAATGTPDRFGGISYVMGLPDECVSTTNAAHYWGMLKNFAQQRRLIDVASDMLDAATLKQPPDEIMARASQQMEDIASRLRDDGHVSLAAEGVDDALAHLEAVENGDADPAIPTGIDVLDEMIGGGLRRKEVHVIAGRPGMGKSALATVIEVTAASAGWSCLAIMAEMTTRQVWNRRLAYWCGVPIARFRSPKDLTASERDRLVEKAPALRALPIATDDRPAPTLAQIEGVVRRHKILHGLDVLVIDFFQILGFEGPSDSVAGKDAMAYGLLRIAKKYDLALVLLSQLNRDCEKRADKRPVMSDLKGCGAVEEVAHVFLCPYRDVVYNEDSDPGEAEIGVPKQRNGPAGAGVHVKSQWQGEIPCFGDPGETPWEADNRAAFFGEVMA